MGVQDRLNYLRQGVNTGYGQAPDMDMNAASGFSSSASYSVSGSASTSATGVLLILLGLVLAWLLLGHKIG